MQATTRQCVSRLFGIGLITLSTMSHTTPISDRTRAAILAELRLGRSIECVAHDFCVSQEAVRSIKRRAGMGSRYADTRKASHAHAAALLPVVHAARTLSAAQRRGLALRLAQVGNDPAKLAPNTPNISNTSDTSNTNPMEGVA